MEQVHVDLKKEQQASMERPRYRYSVAARFFFLMMDMVTGRKETLAKAKLLETLASIPYRAWENRQYARMTHYYQNQDLVQQARMIMTWGREAQDNEYWHLLVINEKMKEDRVRDPWYLFPLIPFLMAGSYGVLSWAIAMLNMHRAFLFNAEFEDHAEHVYAQLVQEHPEWEEQPVNNELVKKYGEFRTWAEVFSRIGLDERDHMNSSFIFCNKPDCVVKYVGMPMVHRQGGIV
jgi:demethoxyubiquinone hydroxylase (CLK1/Coq7/Cat5 family)